MIRSSIIVLAAVALALLVTACGEGASEREQQAVAAGFAANAFPPLLSAEDYHLQAWEKSSKECLVCHQKGKEEAPVTRHEDMPPILLEAKCRSCHVLAASSAVDYQLEG